VVHALALSKAAGNFFIKNATHIAFLHPFPLSLDSRGSMAGKFFVSCSHNIFAFSFLAFSSFSFKMNFLFMIRWDFAMIIAHPNITQNSEITE
jgi:hypothetical protein